MSREPVSFADGVSSGTPRRELTLLDSTCIIVGIIIGAGIYRSSPDVAQSVPDGWWLLFCWLLGGVMSLIGALCYAELVTAYPHAGGDYVYLSRAFGRPLGFLFAWSQFWIVRPGSIGAMAYAFAEYANQLWPHAAGDAKAFVLSAYASAAIIALTLVNLLGIREGKWTQNLLTIAKALGLTLLILIGLTHTAPAAQASTAEPTTFSFSGFGMAMIFVLFTYGGWNEIAYVGAEVKNPQRNVLRALLIGTAAVTAIYLLVNAAFLHALGLAGTRNPAAAAIVLESALGEWGSRALCLLICISALGAVNGQTLTGARIYYAVGAEHRLYAWLSRWNPQRGTPYCSLLLQSTITLALILGFGSVKEGFESMVKFTTPAFWFFFSLVGVALMILRRREPEVTRPFPVPGYPVLPLLFCLSSVYMFYAGLAYAVEHRSWEALWSVGLLLLGVIVTFVESRQPRNAN